MLEVVVGFVGPGDPETALGRIGIHEQVGVVASFKDVGADEAEGEAVVAGPILRRQFQLNRLRKNRKYIF